MRILQYLLGRRASLGVNDRGYSSGLKNDLRYLHLHGYINEESMDKYRNYVKLLLDKAFMNERRTVFGTDITANHVDLRIERNKEGDEMLRIQVKPYEQGVIYFDKELSRPDNVESSYYLYKWLHPAHDKEGEGRTDREEENVLCLKGSQ